MIKTGTVAVYVKSESGDSYLYCFEDETIIYIAEQMRENLEMFCPICDWKIAGKDKDFLEYVDNVMSQIYEESWEREDE